MSCYMSRIRVLKGHEFEVRKIKLFFKKYDRINFTEGLECLMDKIFKGRGGDYS